MKFTIFTILFTIITYFSIGIGYNFVIRIYDDALIKTDVAFLKMKPDRLLNNNIYEHTTNFVYRCVNNQNDYCEEVYKNYTQNHNYYRVNGFYEQNNKKVVVSVNMKCLSNDYTCIDEMNNKTSKETINNIVRWFNKLYVIIHINKDFILRFLTSYFINILILSAIITLVSIYPILIIFYIFVIILLKTLFPQLF